MIYWPNKPAGETRAYGVDWRPVLSKLGDPTIVSSSWARLFGDSDSSSPSVDVDGRGTNLYVAGGTVDTPQKFRNTVQLSDSSILFVDCFFRVRA